MIVLVMVVVVAAVVVMVRVGVGGGGGGRGGGGGGGAVLWLRLQCQISGKAAWADQAAVVAVCRVSAWALLARLCSAALRQRVVRQKPAFLRVRLSLVGFRRLAWHRIHMRMYTCTVPTQVVVENIFATASIEVEADEFLSQLRDNFNAVEWGECQLAGS